MVMHFAYLTKYHGLMERPLSLEKLEKSVVQCRTKLNRTRRAIFKTGSHYNGMWEKQDIFFYALISFSELIEGHNLRLFLTVVL